jgi:presenilin-like A22 family membrane protease
MDRRQTAIATLGALVLVLSVQAGALALVGPFDTTYEPVEDPTNPANGLYYLGAIVVVTALMLAAFRYDLDRVLRWVIVGTSGLLSWYVLSVLLPSTITVGGLNAPALVGSAAVAGALAVHPEWYVIDLAGVLIGASAAALLGISFTPLPAVLLLVALAVYDAVSVYGTEHMLSLAEGVLDLRVPVVLVIPLTLGYSFRDAGTPDAIADGESDGDDPEASAADAGEESPADASEGEADDAGRDAVFLGLGDAVLPTVLVASSAAFPIAGGAIAPTAGAVAGTAVATVVLLRLVAQGRAHAGLPLLNGGAIGGYLLGALAVGVGPLAALGL